MKRTWKCLAALLLVCVMVAVLPGTIGAALAAPTEDNGTLTVTPGSSDELSDLASAHVVLDLYQVATAEITDETTFTYTLNERYSALREGLDQILAGAGGDALRALSQQAAWAALGDEENRDTPTVAGAAERSAISGLQPGLYLVVARGDKPANYVGTMLDESGEAQIVTRVQTENWLYTYLPELVFVPGKPVDEDGNNSPANPGNWQYRVEMTLKPTRENGRLGDLEIVKTLTDFVADHPGFFVFRVDVYDKSGALLRSEIRELHFDAAGQQTIHIDNLPEGAEVVVTEVYDGSSYRLTSDSTVRGTITAGEVFRAEFTNAGSTGDGGAIVNHFSYDNQNGWVWIPSTVIE